MLTKVPTRVLLQAISIIIFTGCREKNPEEKLLRDFYQIPENCIQVIEWTYTTTLRSATITPDSLTSDNREFVFNNKKLTQIISFDSLFKIESVIDINRLDDSIYITEKTGNDLFTIDISQQEKEVLFTKYDNKNKSIIETIVIGYDSLDENIQYKKYIDQNGNLTKLAKYYYPKDVKLIVEEIDLKKNDTILSRTVLGNSPNDWTQTNVVINDSVKKIIWRVTYFKDSHFVKNTYKK